MKNKLPDIGRSIEKLFSYRSKKKKVSMSWAWKKAIADEMKEIERREESKMNTKSTKSVRVGFQDIGVGVPQSKRC